MKILQIAASLDPRFGGVSEGVRRSCFALVSMGHHVELATLDEPGAPYLDGLPYPTHPQGRLIKRYGYTPKLAKWVRKNAGRFDAVILNSLWNHASVGGWHGLKDLGIPYYIFVHGMMDGWFRQSHYLKHWAKQAFWLGVQGRVLRDANAVLFTTEGERAHSRGVFWGYDYTEVVVGYGAGAAPENRIEQLASFYSKVPEVEGKRFLLFLGRIHPIKGCDLLIDTFTKISSSYPNLELVMAGPDDSGIRAGLEKHVPEEISKKIHWTGMLNGDAKWGAFRAAEAFVLPSHHENFGIAVAEALACGTPVVISDKVNIWREVKNGGAGVVGPDTLAGTRSSILAFLRLSEAEKQQLRDKARLAFERHFHIDSAMANLINLMRSDG